MRYFISLAFLIAIPPLANAAEAGGLPPACVAAAPPALPPVTGMEDGGMAETMPMGHGGSGEMNGMAEMNSGMAAAEKIADPDLAFNCGMIAHHRGAIAMAEKELASGKDQASRDLATAIIAAQQREIAAMTAWVAQHAP